LGFPHSYLDEVKNIYVDCTKLSVIARPVGGEQLGFQNKLKDEVVIVTDAKLEIVFASHNMTKMNGYVEEIGRSPKMFQGHSSNVLTSSKIRKAIQLIEQTVVNYNKNGEIYICLIKGPVFNIKGKLSHFIAFFEGGIKNPF
jgi:hypothetical protein